MAARRKASKPPTGGHGSVGGNTLSGSAAATVRRPKCYPMPEAIPATKGATKQPERWVIEGTEGALFGSGHGATNIERGVMQVPLDAEDVARCVRAHETAHARWSPSRVPADLDPMITQAVEDARLHILLAAAGVEMAAGLIPAGTDLVGTAAKLSSSARGVALAALAGMGTGSEAPVAEAFGTVAQAYKDAGRIEEWARVEDALNIARQARDLLTTERRKPKFEDTRRVSEWVRTMLAGREEQRKQQQQEQQQGATNAQKAEARREAERSQEHAKQGSTGRAPRPTPNAGRWGMMRVVRLPLSRPLPKGVWSRRRVRPSDEGTVPRRLERWALDGQVFAASKRARRGTVLVDISGSMDLKPEQIALVLEAAPAARVAAYRGDSSENAGTTGTLWILADRKRRVADQALPVSGGWNVIDGPALRWLARQPGPRVWVSDGAVVGAGGSRGPNLHADAAQIMRTGGIVRVPVVEMAAALLAGRA